MSRSAFGSTGITFGCLSLEDMWSSHLRSTQSKTTPKTSCHESDPQERFWIHPDFFKVLDKHEPKWTWFGLSFLSNLQRYKERLNSATFWRWEPFILPSENGCQLLSVLRSVRSPEQKDWQNKLNDYVTWFYQIPLPRLRPHLRSTRPRRQRNRPNHATALPPLWG